MTSGLVAVLQTVAGTCAWVIGLVFLRFWRRTADTLFALFAAAFWLLALSWILLAVSNPTEETRPWVFGIRAVAFLFIIAARVGKNREAGPKGPALR